MLDYDGTLAPFDINRLQAYPYPGVEERLAALSQLSDVRLVLVTGRAAHELEKLLERRLGSMLKFEIWGNHGWERLRRDGSYQFFPLDERDSKTIEEVKDTIAELGFPEVIETKPASIAVHWRDLRPAQQQQIRLAVEAIHSMYAGDSGLRLLPFDGGLELRPHERTKGTVVEEILAEEGAGLPAAYLGDDLTDEDAFVALGRKGVSILVRHELRDSYATLWIRPPEELLQFLDGWIRASEVAAPPARIQPPASGRG